MNTIELNCGCKSVKGCCLAPRVPEGASEYYKEQRHRSPICSLHATRVFSIEWEQNQIP